MLYEYKPRKSFEKSLTYLVQLDDTIIDEVKTTRLILPDGEPLPEDFHDIMNSK